MLTFYLKELLLGLTSANYLDKKVLLNIRKLNSGTKIINVFLHWNYSKCAGGFCWILSPNTPSSNIIVF